MRYSCGVENLQRAERILKGGRIGLITNPSGLDSDFVSTVDIMKERTNLVRLYAPEHGVRGDVQAGEEVSSYIDLKTGLEVVSLFDKKSFESDYLNGIDCVVYDIQDVGQRHFSYLYIMARVMKDCAEKKIAFLVLDRYNPMGLKKVSGNIFDDAYSCDVGGFSLATGYAMTIGETARYIKGEYYRDCELYVVPCTGLDREADYRTLKLPWILPSPNLPTFESAAVYEGTVLFEGTNVSEGRGTAKPFEFIGAPWMDNEAVVGLMRAENLSGVKFRTVYFRPSFSKYRGELCRGLQLHITDFESFDAYRTALVLLNIIRKLHAEFEFVKTNEGQYFIDMLSGTDALRKDFFDPNAYIKEQREPLERFKDVCRKYYMY